MRRLGAAAIIVASLTAGTACQGSGNDFEPDAEGYLELACSIHRHQRDLTFVEVSEDDQERHLGYATSTALLESGNRELDSELQELSNDLKVAIDEDDSKAFDDASRQLGDTCEGVDDDLSMEPEQLVDTACAIADVLEPGPGPQVLLTSELAGVAAAADDEYADLAAAAGRLVINADDPMDSGHPDQAAIDDFQEECP